MKKLSFFAVTCLVFATILISCADVRKPEQLQSIADMQADVDSLRGVLKANPMDSGFILHTETEAVERRIKNNFYTDTVNMAVARKMDAFKVMRRKLKPLTYDFNNLMKGIAQMDTSLAELKTDIENGDNERDRYDEFILFEQGKVHQLDVICQDYVKSRTEVMKVYYDLYDDLNKFSLELAEKAKSKKQ